MINAPELSTTDLQRKLDRSVVAVPSEAPDTSGVWTQKDETEYQQSEKFQSHLSRLSGLGFPAYLVRRKGSDVYSKQPVNGTLAVVIHRSKDTAAAEMAATPGTELVTIPDRRHVWCYSNTISKNHAHVAIDGVAYCALLNRKVALCIGGTTRDRANEYVCMPTGFFSRIG